MFKSESGTQDGVSRETFDPKYGEGRVKSFTGVRET